MTRAAAFVIMLACAAVPVAVLAGYAGPALIGVTTANGWWVSTAVLAELASVCALAEVQRRMVAGAGAPMSRSRMTAVTYVANAISTTFPAGSALSSAYLFRRLRSWGAEDAAAGFAVAASAVLSLVSFAVFALTCALAVGGTQPSWPTVAVAAATLPAVAILRSWLRRPAPGATVERIVRRANVLLRRPPYRGLSDLRQFIAAMAGIRLRRRQWVAAAVMAGLRWVADLACLAASCKATGMRGWSASSLAYAYLAGLSAATLIPTPGGVGSSDAAMIVVLTNAGAPGVVATESVLLYRLISFVLMALLGGLVWSWSRRANSRWHGKGPRRRWPVVGSRR